jgi:hypothetical protein
MCADSTGIFREAVIGILAAVAKQERVRLSERVYAGLERALRFVARKRLLETIKLRDRHFLSWPHSDIPDCPACRLFYEIVDG